MVRDWDVEARGEGFRFGAAEVGELVDEDELEVGVALLGEGGEEDVKATRSGCG